MHDLTDKATTWLLHLHLALLAPQRDERGDVPGWVMITVMSAAVVAALTPLARDELKGMLVSALNSVK